MNRSILYLVPDLLGPPGGIARYCRMVCRALLGDDTALSVIALNDTNGTVDEANSSFPDMTYNPCLGLRWKFVFKALVETIKFSPTIIMIGHINFAPLGWLLARLVGARLVSFVYGTDVWRPLSLIRYRSLHHSDLIISISNFTAQQAARANQTPLEKIRILYNCLDPGFTRWAKIESGLSMLTVARISLAEQAKGHDYVIRSMPALLTQFPELTYHVVGDGDGRQILEALAKQERVDHAVHFHGFISEEAIARRYAEASLYIMPSRVEGFGFAFIEAMFQGTPTIGGTVDATPEVIVNGKTGYLVNPTSVEAIVTAASRILEDKDLRQRMGQAGISYVEEKFNFSNFQQSLLSYLLEL